MAGEELTFKLIALSHYLDPDATWTTPDGKQWSIERLVREELKAPVRGAACGGTHRLMGYSYALKKRAQRGKPITGDFKRAQTYLRDYHRYTFGLQNPDGSFSTAWFERKASDPSIDRRIKTSGHILEWITFSLTDEELRDPRMVKAVDYLATLMLANPRHTWEMGPLGHALHGLLLYDARVFKDVVPLQARPAALRTGKPARLARKRHRAAVCTRGAVSALPFPGPRPRGHAGCFLGACRNCAARGICDAVPLGAVLPLAVAEAARNSYDCGAARVFACPALPRASLSRRIVQSCENVPLYGPI